jgi:hypothetical protein
MRPWVLLVWLAVACDKPAPGEPCESSGDGFTRVDPCSFVCIESEVPCADGSTVVPDVCSSNPCATDADCVAGFACGRTDSFNRYCLPPSLCPGGFAP